MARTRSLAEVSSSATWLPFLVRDRRPLQFTAKLGYTVHQPGRLRYAVHNNQRFSARYWPLDGRATHFEYTFETWCGGPGWPLWPSRGDQVWPLIGTQTATESQDYERASCVRGRATGI